MTKAPLAMTWPTVFMASLTGPRSGTFHFFFYGRGHGDYVGIETAQGLGVRGQLRRPGGVEVELLFKSGDAGLVYVVAEHRKMAAKRFDQRPSDIAGTDNSYASRGEIVCQGFSNRPCPAIKRWHREAKC